MWKINKDKKAIKFFMYSKSCEDCLNNFEKLNFKTDEEYQDFIKNKVVVLNPDGNTLENGDKILLGFHILIMDKKILK